MRQVGAGKYLFCCSMKMIIINGQMMEPTVFAACYWLACYDGPVLD